MFNDLRNKFIQLEIVKFYCTRYRLREFILTK